jgi:hypothetical protein
MNQENLATYLNDHLAAIHRLILLIENGGGRVLHADDLRVAKIVATLDDELVLLSEFHPKTDRLEIGDEGYAVWFAVLELGFVNVGLHLGDESPDVGPILITVVDTDYRTRGFNDWQFVLGMRGNCKNRQNNRYY